MKDTGTVHLQPSIDDTKNDSKYKYLHMYSLLNSASLHINSYIFKASF